MTWWRAGAGDDVPLWWRIVWPAAWFWEQVSGFVVEQAMHVYLWWTITDKTRFVVTPKGRLFLLAVSGDERYAR